MKEFKIGLNAKLDMLKFRDLGINREKEINKASKEIKNNDFQLNDLVKIMHPNGIRVEVTKIIKETDDTKSFYLKPLSIDTMPPFQSGAYITLLVSIDKRTYKRAYSISSSPSSLNEYRITIKKDGNGIVSNYMFNTCAIGDKFNILGPFGNFTYQSLRDQKDVVFIAGGSGITPFMAYLQDEKFLNKINSLTLFYGAKSEFDLIFKKEIDEIKNKNNKIKVIYVLSEQKRDGYSYGLIDEEKLLKEKLDNKSIFISGPIKMYFYLNEIFKKLDIPNKYIRHEIFKEIPENLTDKTFNLTIKMLDKIITIPCKGNETLINSMEKNRVKTLVHCTVGVCGFCRSKLVKGNVLTENTFLRAADKDYYYIHPCVTYPLSDVIIEIPIK